MSTSSLLARLYTDVLSDLLAEVYTPQPDDAIEGEWRYVDAQAPPADTIHSIQRQASNAANEVRQE